MILHYIKQKGSLFSGVNKFSKVDSHIDAFVAGFRSSKQKISRSSIVAVEHRTKLRELSSRSRHFNNV